MQGSPETMEGIDRQLELLRKHTLDKNFDRLEEAWMDAMESPQQAASRIDVFLEAAETFVPDERKVDRVGALLELLLGAVNDAVPVRSVLRLYGLLVRCFPEKREYRSGFSERFEALYPIASAERAFYEASAFVTSADPVAALVRLETLLKFREGAYVYHRSGWGVGRVVAVDPFLKQVKVDLEQKRQHRIAIDVVDTILEPLSPDSFLALKHEGGSELRRLREEDPVRLVTIVMETQGSHMTMKEIKAKLVPDVIEAESWSKWWNRAKGLLRETGLFRIADRAPHTVERTQKAVSYEEELIARFLRSDWVHARQIARQVARRPVGELSQAWARIREELLPLCSQADAVTALEAALILDRGDEAGAHEGLKAVLGRLPSQDVVKVLESLGSADDQRRGAESLPTVRPDDWESIAAVLLMGTKDVLRDVAMDVLEKEAPARLQELVRDLVRSPKSSPHAFCHVLAVHLDGSQRPAVDAIRERTPRDLLVLVMDLLDHLQHRGFREGRAKMKEILGKVESILGGRGCLLFHQGVKAMDPDEKEDIHGRLVKNDNLTPALKGTLLTALLDLEPALAQGMAKAPWEENAVYVTAVGLVRKRDEYREIVEVKLPKNFEDIGRAAAFGDLSENAEYTSALEERDKLTKRAEKMKAELDRAKVIGPEMVKPGVVGLGSRVRLRNLRTGEELVYSILGPWDGGPDDGVLSYLSPLGRLFLSHAAGDVLEAQLPGGTEKYELLETSSHFHGGKDS